MGVGEADMIATMYLAREASKLWRRIVAEIGVEVQLLTEKWKLLLGGLICQYIHGVAARGVHYLHRPGPVLQDLGFMVLPELGAERGYISESVFSVIFFSFLLWTFHPFIYQSKRFYTVLLWPRVLAFLVASQFLRIITFYSTQLPGPNYHCREGSKFATLPPPNNIFEVLLLNFPRGILYGCGDLIFSSHMIFTLVFVRTYHKYGSKRFVKALAWLLALIQSLLIVASRKHYTVDVVVAWYTVNLVVYFVDRKLPEMPDRTISAVPLLPLSSKEKDKNKGELHKLMNGNSGDAADWVGKLKFIHFVISSLLFSRGLCFQIKITTEHDLYIYFFPQMEKLTYFNCISSILTQRQRTQMNGKHLEDGNHVISETTMNGNT